MPTSQLFKKWILSLGNEDRIRNKRPIPMTSARNIGIKRERIHPFVAFRLNLIRRISVSIGDPKSAKPMEAFPCSHTNYSLLNLAAVAFWNHGHHWEEEAV